MSSYLSILNGLPKLLMAIATSAGGGDANKLVRTSSDGKLDPSLFAASITVSFGAWQDVSLSSGWATASDWFDANASGGLATARVRRGGDRVEISLELKKGSAIARFEQVCTLASEFRPNRRIFLGEVSGDDGASNIMIRPDGAVIIYQGYGQYCFVGGEYNRV